MSPRYTIAVDFDGVIYSYTSPWEHAHVIRDMTKEEADASAKERNDRAEKMGIKTRYEAA